MSTRSAMSRIGVDVGGTFTDLIHLDAETGAIRVGKEPTTPAAPELGVARAVENVLGTDEVAATGYFLHGTTVGLNALLTRTGAVVGLLCTEGFRDILEIRRGDRDDPYDLFWKPAPALVPRRLRIPVRGRMLATGVEHAPLASEDIAAAVATFAEGGVTSVAVAFINAYANPAHELEAERALRAAGFTGGISLSHRISGEYREYERTSTTVIDAFVRGRMADYLDRLGGALSEHGFDGHLLVTRSGGGAMTFAEAAERTFETIMSGPVAGAEGGAELGRALDLARVVTADVGGTSFDTCLISDGRLPVLYEGSIVGMPLQTTWVDVRSIGAGGGSLAYVDIGGLLRVGPQSAGAEPGPAAYGRGGTEPTVTDAAAVLGMLGEGRLAAGVTLDVEASRRAYAPLAERLGLGIEEVCQGVMRIAAANMANAIREITVEQGEDPREAVLMPFGGAGPLFGTLLARELEMRTIVVPPYAGNFSAWGLLGADLVQSAARTRIMPLDDASLAEVDVELERLFAGLATSAAALEGGAEESAVDLRYVGQEHFLTVALPGGARAGIDAAALRERFTADYRRAFGLTMDGAIEIAAVRATVRRSLPRRPFADQPARRGGAPEAHAAVEAWSFTTGARARFPIYDREALCAEDVVAGPAIIVEATATTYVDAEFTARVAPSGALFIDDARGA